MDTDPILIPEGFAQAIEGGESRIDHIKSIDAFFRIPRRMGSLSLKKDGFHHKAIMHPKRKDPSIAAKTGMHPDDQIRLVKSSPVHQLRLAAKEMKTSLPDFLQTPVLFDTFFCRYSHEHQSAAEILQQSAFCKCQECAHRCRHLQEMAAGMGCSGHGTAERMLPIDESIHLPHQHDAGTGPSRLVFSSKPGYVRECPDLESMCFQNRHAVRLRFIFLKSRFRMPEQPFPILLYLRQPFLHSFFQCLKQSFVTICHIFRSSCLPSPLLHRWKDLYPASSPTIRQWEPFPSSHFFR